MSVTDIFNRQNKQADKGAARDGVVSRYIEFDEDGRAWLTTATHDANDKPLPVATAANIKRLVPQVADQLRARGAARRPATDEDRKAAADERARIKSILDHPHAKGRESLATQLALTEGMTAERAAEILATAPAENPFGTIGADPDTEAKEMAERTVKCARDGGFVR